MSRIYRSGNHTAKAAKAATTGIHWSARNIDVTTARFVVGEHVTLARSGKEATVSGVSELGYTLEGYRGWFPAKELKKLP